MLQSYLINRHCTFLDMEQKILKYFLISAKNKIIWIEIFKLILKHQMSMVIIYGILVCSVEKLICSKTAVCALANSTLGQNRHFSYWIFFLLYYCFFIAPELALISVYNFFIESFLWLSNVCQDFCFFFYEWNIFTCKPM